MSRMVVVIVIGLLAAFAALVATVYFQQTAILFPTDIANAAAPSRLPEGTERIEVAAGNGDRLQGVRLPGRRDLPALIGFGGNAWNAEVMALTLAGLFPDREIVAFHYRGYRPSEGSPSAAAILADAPRLFDGAFAGDRRVVAVGFSIGATVGATLSRERRLAGLVMVTPFDTLEALAKEHYSWAPVGLFIRHRMSTAEAMEGNVTPTAMITASRDAIVPPRRSAALRPAIGRLVFDRTIEAGHNDLYDRREFAAAMREALERVEAVR